MKLVSLFSSPQAGAVTSSGDLPQRPYTNSYSNNAALPKTFAKIYMFENNVFKSWPGNMRMEKIYAACRKCNMRRKNKIPTSHDRRLISFKLLFDHSGGIP